MYLITQTQPNISFPVLVLSHFNHNPSPAYQKALQRVICYLQTTEHFGITYRAINSNKSGIGLHVYSNSDYVRDIDTRKSTSRYIFYTENRPILQRSTCQHAVTLSSTKAEYYALTEAAKEAIWLQTLLTELGYSGDDIKPLLVYRDNTGSLAIAENPEHHQWAKHINIRAHFIYQCIENSSVELSYIPTDQIVADGFTKPLTNAKHRMFIKQLDIELYRQKQNVFKL